MMENNHYNEAAHMISSKVLDLGPMRSRALKLRAKMVAAKNAALAI